MFEAPKVILVIFLVCVQSEGRPRKKPGPNQFSFFAQIRVPEEIDGETRFRLCAATIIHPQWVLTVAHCFPAWDQLQRLEEDASCTVYAGSQKVFDPAATLNQVATIRIHPQFVHQEDAVGVLTKLTNDIAVAKLNHPYQLGANIQTTSLPPKPFAGRPYYSKYRCLVGLVVGVRTLADLHSARSNLVFTPTESKEEHDVSLFMNLSTTMFYSETSVVEGETAGRYSGSPFVCFRPFFDQMVLVQYGLMSYVQNNSRSETSITAYEAVDRHMEFILNHVPNVTIYGVIRRLQEPRNDKGFVQDMVEERSVGGRYGGPWFGPWIFTILYVI